MEDIVFLLDWRRCACSSGKDIRLTVSESSPHIRPFVIDLSHSAFVGLFEEQVLRDVQEVSLTNITFRNGTHCGYLDYTSCAELISLGFSCPC